MRKIAIHSAPRSGSTWLGSIFDSHPKVIYKFQPLFSYAFKGRLTALSSREEINKFYDDLATTSDGFIDQEEAKEKGSVPLFHKSSPEAVVYKEVRYHHILENLLDQSEDVKVIGLIRNPLAVIHSWWKAPKEFRVNDGWDLMEEWRYAPLKNLNKPEEFNGYEKWKEVALLFHELREKHSKQFLLVSYDDLLKNTEDAVRKIFQFSELEPDQQTLDFVLKSRSSFVDDPYGVFKAKSNDLMWKKGLPSSIIDIVQNDLMGTELEIYLKQE